MPKIFIVAQAALLFLGFIYYTWLVSQQLFNQVDFSTTVSLQDRIPRSLDLFFSVLTLSAAAEISVLVWLGLSVFYTLKKFYSAAIGLLLFPLATLIEVMGKLNLYHPGPPYLFYRGVFDLALPSGNLIHRYSYPSGHMTRASFLVFFLLGISFKSNWRYKSLIQLTLLLFLGLMFISRIYLGEHWFTDVVGGLLLGSSFGLVSSLFVPKSLR